MTSQRQRRSTESFHYVVLAGNGGRAIFLDDQDRESFTGLVKRFAQRCEAQLHAYCWTPSDARMLLEVRPQRLPTLMARIGSQHATHINAKRASTGDRVFHGRYNSAGVIEDEDVLDVVLHIHRTPIELDLMADVADYRWSSHQAYLGQAAMPWVMTRYVTELLQRKYPLVGAYGCWFGHASSVATAHPATNRPVSATNVSGDAEFLSVLLERARLRSVRFSIEEVTAAVLRWLMVNCVEIPADAKDDVMRLARALVADYVKNNKIATLEAVAEHLHRSPSALSEAIVHFRKMYTALFDMPLETLLRGPGPAHRQTERILK